MARIQTKPAGTLTVTPTGQYAGLRAFYAFNEAPGSASVANLAPGGGTLALSGGGVLASDATGGHYQPAAGAAAAAIPSATLAGLGVTSSGITVFARLAPPGNEGIDRVVFALPMMGGLTIALDTYGTIYEFRSSFGSSIGGYTGATERPFTSIETVVATLTDTGTLTLYVNGVAAYSGSIGSYVDTAGKLAVGYDPVAGFANAREKLYEVGIVAGAWTALQAARYDSNPLEAVGIAEPVVPTNQTLIASRAESASAIPTGGYAGWTRFYLPSSGTAPVNVSATTGWDQITSLTRAPLNRSPAGTALANFSASESSATSAQDTLVRQFISEPLEAQTITGRVRGIVRGRENLAAANFTPAIVVKVVNSTGTTQRGIPYNLQSSANSNEFIDHATTLRTQKFPRNYSGTGLDGGAALTSTTVQAGDRLVIEVGARAGNTASTQYIITLNFGDPTDGTALLPENETTTAVGVPWIEFSGPIRFQSAAAAPVTQTLTATRAVNASSVPAGGTVTQSAVPTVNLTPAAITTASPVPARPVLAQAHGLTAAPITAAAPAPDRPALKHGYSLTAAPVTTASPVADRPAATQAHALAPAAITTAAPPLARPAAAQGHSVTPAAITTGTPLPDRPALAQSGTLTPAGITAAAPPLARPALSQAHALAVVQIAAGTATAPRPALAQSHGLAAAGITSGAPAPGRPALAASHALAAAPITAGPPAADRPGLIQGYALAAAAVLAGVAVLGAPAVTQNHALAAPALSSAAPALDTPPLQAAPGQLAFTPVPVTAGSPVAGRPALAQGHAIAPAALAAGAPAPGRPALAQAHGIAVAGISLPAPAPQRPALAQGHALAAAGILGAAAVLDRPAVVLAGELAPVGVTAGQPVTGRPGLVQSHALFATAIVTGLPALPAPAVALAGQISPAAILAGPPALDRPGLHQGHGVAASVLSGPAPVTGRPGLAQRHALAVAGITAPPPVLANPVLAAGPIDPEPEPVGLGGMMFVSMTEAKAHLRVDFEDDDFDIEGKLLAAEQQVADYINRPIPWVDAAGNEVPAPHPIRAATLLYLGDLYQHREAQTERKLTDNAAAVRLLARYRDFD